MPRRYPAEFRRKVLDLVEAGRPVARVAHDLDISAQCIYTWRRQQLIDRGQLPGITSTDHAELVAARKRIPPVHSPPPSTAPAPGCSREAGALAAGRSWP